MPTPGERSSTSHRTAHGGQEDISSAAKDKNPVNFTNVMVFVNQVIRKQFFSITKKHKSCSRDVKQSVFINNADIDSHKPIYRK